MGKGNAQFTRRGFVALGLSTGVGLTAAHGVADTWRSSIDTALGTASTRQTEDEKFTSTYATTDELVAAHEELGIQMGQEGCVLMKNEGQALPLAKGAKVTLFGMGAYYSFLGGEMGSTVTSELAVYLPDALAQRGFEVNPTMSAVYNALGEFADGETQANPFVAPTPNYVYRPSGFSTPYVPSEPSPDVYTTDGGADASYTDSFAEYGDAAIVVFSRPGSEGSDFYPGDTGVDSATYGTANALGLTTNERAVLALAEENFSTVVVLINSGSTMEVEPLKADSKVGALMYVGFPGVYGYLGVADVLDGDANPSGKLADTYAVDTAMAPASQNFGDIELADLSMITWPDSLMPGLGAAQPLSTFGGDSSTASDCYVIEAEGIYTGYKYYETRYYDCVAGLGNADSATGASNGASAWDYDAEVSYPFGYGLSYTTFDEKLESVDVDTSAKTVKATVTVTNTGDVAGKHVVELFCGVPYTDYDKENGVEKAAVQLLGIEKTDELAPGDDTTVELEVPLKYLGSWDSGAKDGKGGFILDGGDYVFTLGNGAHEAVQNVMAAQGVGEVGSADATQTVTVGSEGSVDEDTLAYSENGTEVVNQLADADVNYYKPGYCTYLSRSDWDATFPRTYNDLVVEGDKLEEWVQNLASEVYQVTENGTVENVDGSGGSLTLSDLAGNDDIDDAAWADLIEQIPLDTLIAKVVKGGSQTDYIEEIQNPVVYQNDGPNGFSGTISGRGLHTDDANANYAMGTMCNCTMMASTFNKELMHAYGQLLGNDGLWSGNYLIWASAANLHRCPYNGRNFEYYSEDPMLSNFMAAELVSGALELGIIVGPKHFAFNDQETKRAGVAPYMTEQKAREGELRAFQGSVEEAGAIGMMTSFGRIGATPVNGSWGLLKNILRGEWGFKGLISTDMVSNPGYFRPEMCIYGGITMMADFSTDETIADVLESWPYLTEELVEKDATLTGYLRENMKYEMYAFAHSAAQNVRTEKITPWWEAALNGATYAGFGIAAVAAALYAKGVVDESKAGAAKEEK